MTALRYIKIFSLQIDLLPNKYFNYFSFIYTGIFQIVNNDLREHCLLSCKFGSTKSQVSLKNKLPLTIAAYSRKDLTLTCAPLFLGVSTTVATFLFEDFQLLHKLRVSVGYSRDFVKR